MKHMNQFAFIFCWCLEWGLRSIYPENYHLNLSFEMYVIYFTIYFYFFNYNIIIIFLFFSILFKTNAYFPIFSCGVIKYLMHCIIPTFLPTMNWNYSTELNNPNFYCWSYSIYLTNGKPWEYIGNCFINYDFIFNIKNQIYR